MTYTKESCIEKVSITCNPFDIMEEDGEFNKLGKDSFVKRKTEFVKKLETHEHCMVGCD